MRKLFLLLAALSALLVVVTAYGKNKIGFDICHKTGNGKYILLKEMPIDAWDNGHSRHTGDFLADDRNPCPPNQGNYSPAPTPTQVPPGPPPNPVPTDTPEDWHKIYLPVEFHESDWYCPVGLCD